MSEFDFDRLRDPLAPEPGAHERAAVETRAIELRARARRNRLRLSSISVVAVVALVFGIVATQRDDGKVNVEGPGGTTPAISQPLGSTTTTTTTRTTTTTTPPPGPPAPALSATWISPDHGWVLQRNGHVAETTDGGATWTVVGTVAANAGNGRIRFANSSVGYAFDLGHVFGTADGGRSWRLLNVPFHGAADLAIWNGTVYAASYNEPLAMPPTVDVWTTTVGRSSWTKHPTGVPIGAGPIPQTQLVLSGTGGWLLQVDRDIAGGAQLTANGEWIPWTPPCKNAGGAVYLAASSDRDLVASCEEGAYTGSFVRWSIRFSHDGGVTFDRHEAPQAGPVATPDATTALVPGTDTLQRTTDGGATWHSVYGLGYSAVDLGFTTATQGFIIYENGQMFMTHDAGATWQEVILP